MKKILFCLAVLSTLFSCNAKKANNGELEYALTNDGYVVTGIGNCEDENIIIPSKYKNKDVIGIGDMAFYNCSSFTSINIPDSIRFIGIRAFALCSSLQSISIPSKVKRINKSTFEACYDLTTVELSNSITSIADNAFTACTSLTSINLPNTVKDIGTAAFAECTSLASVNLSNDLIYIGYNAFIECNSLIYNEYKDCYYLGSDNNPYYALVKALDKDATKIEINENTKFILSNAFASCSLLTSIEIPNSIINIGYNAFLDCNALEFNKFENCNYLGNKDNPYLVIAKSSNDETIKIHDSTKIIMGRVFRQNVMESITIPNNVISIGGEAFYGCKNLILINMPNSLKCIGGSAFESCSSLTKIDLPDSVTYIGKSAFSRCESLKEFSFPKNITYIPDSLLYGQNSLKTIVINKNITVIEDYALCCPLKEITIPNSVTSIGEGAFLSCDFTSIEIPNSVTSLSNQLFLHCEKLTSIKLPNTIRKIGDEAFSYCSSLVKITLPNGVTRLGDSLFLGDMQLENIDIPSSVNYIGDFVFGMCLNLKYNEYENCFYVGDNVNPYIVLVKAKDKSISEAKIHNKTKIIYSQSFMECGNLESIKIPSSVKCIGYQAFFCCKSLTTIDISLNISSIGLRAFTGCDSLNFNEFGNCLYIGSKSNPYYILFKSINTEIEEVTIHNKTVYIMDLSFDSCRSLKSIIVPLNVKYIKNYPFNMCHLNLFCEAKIKPNGWETNPIWPKMYFKDQWHYENGVPTPNVVNND